MINNIEYEKYERFESYLVINEERDKVNIVFIEVQTHGNTW